MYIYSFFVVLILLLLLKVSFSESDSWNSVDNVKYVSADHSSGCSFSLKDESRECKAAIIGISSKDVKEISKTLQKVISQELIHKVILEGFDITAYSLGEIVDHFLSVHLWWVIRKEIYNHNGKVIHDGHSVDNNSIHLIVLVKYKLSFENMLKFTSAIQNPTSQAICDNTTLLVGRMVDSGWGSQAGMYSAYAIANTYSIFNLWHSFFNRPDESLAMIHYKDCKEGLINKWECLFLPLTNCSMENVEFTKCHEESSDHRPACWKMGEFFKVRNMGVDGGPMIRADSPIGSREPVNSYQYNVEKTYDYAKSKQGVLEGNMFIGPKGAVHDSHVGALLVLLEFGLFSRPNYNLRSRIDIAVRELEAKKQIPPYGANECVAIHIRRGDRTLPGIDMKALCDAARKASGQERTKCNETLLKEFRNANHDWIGDNFLTCGRLLDLGCYAVHSFGEVTLVDYLQKGKALLPNAKHAFVMTDDGEWLEEEIRNLPSQTTSGVSDWLIGRWPQGKEDRRDWGNKGNGTIGAINFWGSIHVARSCSAMVGHFSSGVSWYLFDAMCYRYKEHTGRCPPGADVGGEHHPFEQR